jgi:menaquinone-dependent protoporphyrinogen IX oxidase
MMELKEAANEGVSWDGYDVVVIGAPVFYGTFASGLYQLIVH